MQLWEHATMHTRIALGEGNLRAGANILLHLQDERDRTRQISHIESAQSLENTVLLFAGIDWLKE